jgi:hypothetical protein
MHIICCALYANKLYIILYKDTFSESMANGVIPCLLVITLIHYLTIIKNDILLPIFGGILCLGISVIAGLYISSILYIMTDYANGYNY